MTKLTAQEREIREILVAANCGEATVQQVQRLDEMIIRDQRLAKYCAQVVEQQASLAWQASHSDGTARHRKQESQTSVRIPTTGRSSTSRRPAAGFAAIAASLAFIMGGGAIG